ncbi:hypothetical protein Tco_1116734 [Tanacetum coccineum]
MPSFNSTKGNSKLKNSQEVKQWQSESLSTLVLFFTKMAWMLLSSQNALWVQVMKSYHGQEGVIDTMVSGTRNRFWKDIWG